MVLVDDDMASAGFEGNNWIEQKVSKLQNIYLRNCEKKLMYASRRSKSPTKELAGRPSLPVTYVPTSGGEKGGAHHRQSSPSALGVSTRYFGGSKSSKLSRVRPLSEHESKTDNDKNEAEETTRIESQKAAEKFRVSSLLLAESDRSMNICKYCHKMLDGGDEDTIQFHLKYCEPYSFLKADFKKIDKKIQESQLVLSKINEISMNKCLQKAFDEFSGKMSTNFTLMNLLNGVVNLKFDTFKSENMIDLEQSFQSFRSRLKGSTSSTADDDTLTIESLDEKTVKIYLDIIDVVGKLMIEKASKASNVMSLCDYVFKRRIYVSSNTNIYLAKIRTASDPSEKPNEKQYVIKVIGNENELNNEYSEKVLKERKILHVLKNQSDYFCHLYDSFTTNGYLYLVLNHEPFGDALSLLTSLQCTLNEDTARGFLAQICFALKHLHENHIVHRDIKLDNILITKNGHAKISDFGVSTFFTQNRQTKVRAGSSTSEISNTNSNISSSLELIRQSKEPRSKESSDLGTGSKSRVSGSIGSDSELSSLDFRVPGMMYSVVGNIDHAAPEVIIGLGYDTTIDWWALGILAFHCVCGDTPFSLYQSKDVTNDVAGSVDGGDIFSRENVEVLSQLQMESLKANIVEGKIRWEMFPPQFSKDCKTFIEQLLQLNPRDRLSGDEALNHSFFVPLSSSGVELHRSTRGPLFDLIADVPNDFRRPEKHCNHISADDANSLAAAIDYGKLLLGSIENPSFESALVEALSEIESTYRSGAEVPQKSQI